MISFLWATCASALKYASSIDIYSENSQLIFMGFIMGIIVVSTLNFFPGEPFDYEKDLVLLQQQTESKGQQCSVMQQEDLNELKGLEVEKAASRIKIAKLQELLGLEEQEVKALVEKAKADTLAGKTPEKRINYMQWADGLFYTAIVGLLVYFGCRDYGISITQMLGKIFPAEVEVIQRFNPLFT